MALAEPSGQVQHRHDRDGTSAPSGLLGRQGRRPGGPADRRITSVFEPNGLPFVDVPDMQVGSMDPQARPRAIPDPVNRQMATVLQVASVNRGCAGAVRRGWAQARMAAAVRSVDVPAAGCRRLSYSSVVSVVPIFHVPPTREGEETGGRQGLSGIQRGRWRPPDRRVRTTFILNLARLLRSRRAVALGPRGVSHGCG